MGAANKKTTIPSAAPKGFVDNLGSDLLVIRVGPKRKEFSVHKHLLYDTVPLFPICYDETLSQGKITIYLKWDEPGVFALFVEWLYRGSIPNGPKDHDEHIKLLIKLQTFAQRLRIYQLVEKVLDRIQDIMNDDDLHINFELMRNAYIYASTKSKLRQYCMDEILYFYSVTARYTFMPNSVIPRKNLLDIEGLAERVQTCQGITRLWFGVVL